MIETLKKIWLDHKKKIIALIIMALTAAGLLNDDVKEAIHEATAPKIEAQVAAPVVEIPAVSPAPKVEAPIKK